MLPTTPSAITNTANAVISPQVEAKLQPQQLTDIRTTPATSHSGRIIVWQANTVLQVRVSALFRRGKSWGLFVVENGIARLREVEIGQRTPFQAEIKSGLEEGAEVIVHPSSEITDGASVEMQER